MHRLIRSEWFRVSRFVVGVSALVFVASGVAFAAADSAAAIERAAQRIHPRATVRTGQATNVATLVAVPRASDADLAADLAESAEVEQRSMQFLAKHGRLFGIRDAATELVFDGARDDSYGDRHLSFRQVHEGIPVLGAVLKTHFDADGQLYATSGQFIPAISIATVAEITASRAAQIALTADAYAHETSAPSLRQEDPELALYHTGLKDGRPGTVHLVWRVAVTTDPARHEFVFVDAHTGRIIERTKGTLDDLSRRGYDLEGSPVLVPDWFPNIYPDQPAWVEGDLFPTGNDPLDRALAASAEYYDLFYNTVGRDGPDFLGTTMDVTVNWGVYNAFACIGCPLPPGALQTVYGVSFATDDVVGHEWGHWTHVYSGVSDVTAYAGQNGSFGEGISDVFGETLDLINSNGDFPGTDSPDHHRTPDGCPTGLPVLPELTVLSPVSIAGVYVAGPLVFGAEHTPVGVTAGIELAEDSDQTCSESAPECSDRALNDACQPLTNAAEVAGKFALVSRGNCSFVTKAQHAQDAGAVGAIVFLRAADDEYLTTIEVIDPAITIPTAIVTLETATTIIGELAEQPTVNLAGPRTIADPSMRWREGEDTDFVLVRDMWNPNCVLGPGKVSDPQYYCGNPYTVHRNSMVVSHAYALLVDGGNYNGRHVRRIGLSKAFHIYYRAMDVYQSPVTNFAEHADALEQACSDLVGEKVVDIRTYQRTAPVTAKDCEQVAEAIAAVELRATPCEAQ